MSSKPRFAVEKAVDVVREVWRIDEFDEYEFHPLDSYDDQNFHVRSRSRRRDEFVFKIASTQITRDVLELENLAINSVAAAVPGLTARVLPSASGELLVPIGETEHHARLLSFVPGGLMANVPLPRPEGLHRSLGCVLGSVDRALLGVQHPAAHRPGFLWDLQNVLLVREHLHFVKDERRRALLTGHLRRFESWVQPVLQTLRQSVIQNDANDHNIIVDTDAAGVPKVAGLIDFGDVVYTYTVCEVAIAAAYAMLDEPDPLRVAANVVSGYHSVLPLSERELEVVFPLMCLRLVTSVVNSARRQTEEPDNAYIAVSERPAWQLLEYLDGVSPSLPHYVIRHACGLEPCPASAAVARALRGHAAAIGPMLRLDTSAPYVFDFTSKEATSYTSEFIAKCIRDSGAAVGLGRYNEKRAVYTTDSYNTAAAAAGTSLDKRNIHLGVDVFAPAGTPLLCPIDGTVHSFQDNAQALDYGPTIILQHCLSDGRDPVTFYTLYGHLSRASLEGLQVGMEFRKGAQLATVGDSDVNGGWPPHLHFQLMTDMMGRFGDFIGVGRESQRAVWLSVCPDPNLVLRFPALSDAGAAPVAVRTPAEIVSVRREHVNPAISTSYGKHALKIVRGRGQYLYDEEGHEFLDCVNNVCHVGHCHPDVVSAGQNQMAELNTNTRYLYDALADYTQRLLATVPAPLSVATFVCSGSEANDLALRMCRAATGRHDVLVVDCAYHGNTSSLIDLSPYKFNGRGGKGKPAHVHVVPSPDTYRGEFRGPDAGEKYALHVKAALDAAAAAGRPIAAFFCESVLGCAGQVVLPPGYLAAVFRYVREAGALCVSDEVQVGFGRVGSHYWGFETQGVVPDIVTMGKPIGNGHPIGAVVCTRDVADKFANGMEYFNTFGGSPVSCKIGVAVLDAIRDDKLQENSLRVGNHLMDGLRALMPRHKLIGEVRGLGLFIGIELVRSRETLEPAGDEADAVVGRMMREHRILLSTDGPFHNVIKFKPPLPFSMTNADTLINALDLVLSSMPAK